MPHYCPQCDAEVGAKAMHCSGCPAKFTWPSAYRPIFREKASAGRTLYRVVLFLTPFIAIFGTFAGLCVVECTALPWVGFVVGPIAAVVCTVAARLIAGRLK
ncbi:MAG: hypothetical protein V4787_27285 [Pseudomonadota bacterium]